MKKNKTIIFSIVTVVSCLSMAFSFLHFKYFNKNVLFNANAAQKTYTLTIEEFKYKNTYYLYKNTTNGNQLTFTREGSSYSTGKYYKFYNSTPIHYLKTITATYTANETVTIVYNILAQNPNNYSNVTPGGGGGDACWSSATIHSGSKFTFPVSNSFYFYIRTENNQHELGLTKLVITYNCE